MLQIQGQKKGKEKFDECNSHAQKSLAHVKTSPRYSSLLHSLQKVFNHKFPPPRSIPIPSNKSPLIRKFISRFFFSLLQLFIFSGFLVNEPGMHNTSTMNYTTLSSHLLSLHRTRDQN